MMHLLLIALAAEPSPRPHWSAKRVRVETVVVADVLAANAQVECDDEQPEIADAHRRFAFHELLARLPGSARTSQVQHAVPQRLGPTVSTLKTARTTLLIDLEPSLYPALLEWSLTVGPELKTCRVWVAAPWLRTTQGTIVFERLAREGYVQAREAAQVEAPNVEFRSCQFGGMDFKRDGHEGEVALIASDPHAYAVRIREGLSYRFSIDRSVWFSDQPPDPSKFWFPCESRRVQFGTD